MIYDIYKQERAFKIKTPTRVTIASQFLPVSFGVGGLFSLYIFITLFAFA